MNLIRPRQGPLLGIWISIAILVSLATANTVREPTDLLQHIGGAIQRENVNVPGPVTSPTQRQHQPSFLKKHTNRPNERGVKRAGRVQSKHKSNDNVVYSSRGHYGKSQELGAQAEAKLRDDQHDFSRHRVHNVLWRKRNQKKWDQVNLLTIDTLSSFDVVNLEGLSCANFVQRFLLKDLLINSIGGNAKSKDSVTFYGALRSMFESTDSLARKMMPNSVRLRKSYIKESQSRLDQFEVTSDDTLEFQRLFKSLVETYCAEQLIRSFFWTSGKRRLMTRGPTAEHNRIVAGVIARDRSSLELNGHHYASYMNIVDVTKRAIVESIDDFWCWHPRKRKFVPKKNPIGSIDQDQIPTDLFFKTDPNFSLRSFKQAYIDELAKHDYLASSDTLLLWENVRQIRNLNPGPDKHLGRYPSRLKERGLFSSMSDQILRSLDGTQGLQAEIVVDAFQHLLMLECSKGYFPKYLWKLWKKKIGSVKRLQDSWDYRNLAILELGEAFAAYLKSFKQINLIQGEILHYSQHAIVTLHSGSKKTALDMK
ncbi:hypothetical protein DFH28DRAFT_941809 [Melampsora americana]|nr:hypothetical protein DFH28DRAFT_941809 [Melampsora americana]